MMTTRRKIVSGLAAIVVSGQAPALVKSLVGSKSVSYDVNDGNYIGANQYIQDGLISIWDGIENVRLGKHDHNALVWKDLKGNLDLPVRAGGYFLDNAISNVGSSSAQMASGYFNSTSLEDIRMFEIVFNITSLSQMVFCCSHSNIGYGLFASLYNPYAYVSIPNASGASYYFTYGKSGYVDDRWQGTHSVSVGYDDSMVPTYAMYNGEEKQISTMTAYRRSIHNNYVGMLSAWDTGADASRGSFYCARLYSRVLTPEEIDYNHTIDSMRFGI